MFPIILSAALSLLAVGAAPATAPATTVANTVIQPGHRLMVLITSSAFPLYDRNPQTFAPNIFNARPEDYRKATITILRGGDNASAILLPVVTEGAAGK